MIIMSCPSEKAWACGMWMLTWLSQNRLRGIKFTHDVPQNNPISFSDSSFMHGVKDHGLLIPHDYKDQYGWIIMWQGGPIAWASRKHNHVGRSTCQVEYMALFHNSNVIIHLRQLLNELNVNDVLYEPTWLFGDNKSANKIVEDDIITSGNQYIYMNYHAVKETARMGIVSVFMKKSAHNLADLFTKNVSAGVIKSLLDVLCGYKVIQFDPD
jgi:hypothetical protein